MTGRVDIRQRVRRFLKYRPGDIIYDLFVFFYCLTVFIVVAYPLWYIILGAISDPAEVFKGRLYFLPKGINSYAITQIINDSRIWRGYSNTIMYTILGLTINMVVTSMAAYATSIKTFKARKYIMLYFIFTMFFGGGLIPLYMLVRSLGLINTVWSLVLPGAINVYNMAIVRAYFMGSIPDELYEAAVIDGCSHFRYFLTIATPLAVPVLSVIGLYYFVGHWNNWFSALIFLNEDKKYPLQLVLRSILLLGQASGQGGSVVPSAGDMEIKGVNLYSQLRTGQLRFGIIIVSSVPLMVIYLFIQKYFEKGIMMGALKG